MTRRSTLLAVMVLALLGGSAVPALASDGSTRVCVNATHDRNNPGPAALCVWVPVDHLP